MTGCTLGPSSWICIHTVNVRQSIRPQVRDTISTNLRQEYLNLLKPALCIDDSFTDYVTFIMDMQCNDGYVEAFWPSTTSLKSVLEPLGTGTIFYTRVEHKKKTQGWLVTLKHPSLRWPISGRTLLLKRRMNSCYWWGWPEGWGRGKGERFKPGEPCSPGNSHPHVNKARVCMRVSIRGQTEKRGKDKWKRMVGVGSWGKRPKERKREGKGPEMTSLCNSNSLKWTTTDNLNNPVELFIPERSTSQI